MEINLNNVYDSRDYWSCDGINTGQSRAEQSRQCQICSFVPLPNFIRENDGVEREEAYQEWGYLFVGCPQLARCSFSADRSRLNTSHLVRNSTAPYKGDSIPKLVESNPIAVQHELECKKWHRRFSIPTWTLTLVTLLPSMREQDRGIGHS